MAKGEDNTTVVDELLTALARLLDCIVKTICILAQVRWEKRGDLKKIWNERKNHSHGANWSRIDISREKEKGGDCFAVC